MYGEEALYQDAVDYLLPPAYQKAIEELEVNPLALPEIDVKEISKKMEVSFWSYYNSKTKCGTQENIKI